MVLTITSKYILFITVLQCPLPHIENAEAFSDDTVNFQEFLTITCMTGFGVNGTTTSSIPVQCGTDQMFEPPVKCLSKYTNKYYCESLTITCWTGF